MGLGVDPTRNDVRVDENNVTKADCEELTKCVALGDKRTLIIIRKFSNSDWQNSVVRVVLIDTKTMRFEIIRLLHVHISIRNSIPARVVVQKSSHIVVQ